MDADIGRLFAKLKDLGIDEKTIVFFTSDNGPHKEGGADPEFFDSAGPLQGYKRSLHDGGIRVPMIVRWPGKVKAGSVSDLPWAFWDFLPTAADLAGADTPPGLDGLSVLPTLLGKPDQPQHEFLYWEFHEGGSSQAVRMGPWKAVRPWGGAVELYDIERDIDESDNVSAAHPEVVSKIEDYLSRARTESEYWPMRQPQRRR
jgi:arylsulfatase A-like enzyme